MATLCNKITKLDPDKQKMMQIVFPVPKIAIFKVKQK
jgi:hypothetical protein